MEDNRTEISVDPQKILISKLGSNLKSVDFHFGENRVWSIDLRDKPLPIELDWHPVLKPYLIGKSLVTIKDSNTGEIILREVVKFTDDPQDINVVGPNGENLVINKWGRLAPDLVSIGGNIQPLILNKTDELVTLLEKIGHRPFIVGGTLLGGIRDGKLLPHDDDADIAYLSRHTHPMDVALEGYELGHLLEKHGYILMRHSATHMQLHFDDGPNGAEYYIDIFSAFFTEDGYINQPFHVRGEMKTVDMLPFGEVKIGDHALPTPRNTEQWLTINYDKEWRTPIPGFKIVTPEPTRRRFENWFGAYNFQREFWNDYYRNQALNNATSWQAGQNWIAKQQDQLETGNLLDLGTGDGSLAAKLANPRRKVFGIDFADKALGLATDNFQNVNVKTHHANFYRLNSISIPRDLNITGSFDIVGNHLLEQVGDTARPSIYRLIRMALRSGGNAIFTINTKPAQEILFEDPTTWHLDPLELKEEANRFGLDFDVFPVEMIDNQREPAGIIFREGRNDSDTIHDTGGTKTMGDRIKRFIRSIDPRFNHRRIKELEAEIRTLKEDIDEYRAQSGRITELIDLAEQKLSPGTITESPDHT